MRGKVTKCCVRCEAASKRVCRACLQVVCHECRNDHQVVSQGFDCGSREHADMKKRGLIRENAA